MDHAARVRDVERQQQLGHDRHHMGQVEAGLAVEVGAQAGALDEFHRDVRDVLFLAVFVDADDVGVVQPPRGARLVLEAADELLDEVRVDEVHAHGLDRDRALDVRVERLVDDAHGALAEDALEFVLAEFLDFAHRLRARRESTQISSIRIAWIRLVFIRPSAWVRVPISSLLLDWNSPASRLPRLTASAMPASRVTRRMTIV